MNQEASKRFVREVDVLEAEIVQCKGHIVMTRKLGETNFLTEATVWWDVPGLHWLGPFKRVPGNQQQGLGQPRLIDACGEQVSVQSNPIGQLQLKLLKKLLLVLLEMCRNTQCIAILLQTGHGAHADPPPLPKVPKMGMSALESNHEAMEEDGLV